MDKNCSNCKYVEVCSPQLFGEEEFSKKELLGFCGRWQPIPDLEPCICERIVEAVIGLLRRALDAAEFKLLDLIWKWIERH